MVKQRNFHFHSILTHIQTAMTIQSLWTCFLKHLELTLFLVGPWKVNSVA